MSALVVEPDSKAVQGIEISSGLIKDFIDGAVRSPGRVDNISPGAMVPITRRNRLEVSGV